MKQKKCIAGILLLGAICAQANNYEVTSPDGRLAVKVECVDGKQCIINKKGWQISESVTLFILCFNPFFRGLVICWNYWFLKTNPSASV